MNELLFIIKKSLCGSASLWLILGLLFPMLFLAGCDPSPEGSGPQGERQGEKVK